MKLTSTTFGNNARIPAKHTCDGDDISPGLSWDEMPNGARSYVLIVDDPDALDGGWQHWVVCDLPADVCFLEEGISLRDPLFTEARILPNSWGQKKYQGPCPPGNEEHHYNFELYALDRFLALPQQADFQVLKREMKPYVLDRALLTGVYQRS